MYSKIAEEEDIRMAEGRHKDADGILIFVGPHIDLRASYYTHKFHLHRVVYSLPP